MHERKVHLHSILVHAVVALVPVAAAAFVLAATGARLGGFGPEVWRFLLRAALALALLLALTVTLSGVLERAHMFVNWNRTHRLKLALSAALIGLLGGELAWLAGSGNALVLLSPAGALIVLANTAAGLALSALGLKMTLGRQGLGRTSYRPDMWRDPRVDILAATAARLAEPPDLVDVLGEPAP